MKSIHFSIILAALLGIFLFGCAEKEVEKEIKEPVKETEAREEPKELAIENCIKECKAQLEKGADLSEGPCLSNEIVPDWVCDVAHSPREAIDNQPKNQCSAWREGKANHFVEVGTDCNLIKVY